MADIQISVDAGTQTRLLTSGKYCKDDILVTASGGSKTDNWNEIITGASKDFFDKEATSLITSSFQGNLIISSVAFPNVVTVGDNLFRGSSSLVKIHMPALQNTEISFAYSCKNLDVVYIPSVTEIGNYAFAQSSKISAIILGGEQVVSLSNINALNSSGIAFGTGYVYVPDDLVEQYKVATNWSTYAAQIKGRSELPAKVQGWLDQQVVHNG